MAAFDKAADGDVSAARPARPRWKAADEEVEFVGAAHRLAIVQPHPDFGAVAHGRAQLQLCAIAGGGHIVLIQHQVRGRTIIAHTCEAGTERSEEHTSELQSLMRISYAVFC